MSNTLIYVRGDDWEGLYVNGIIHYQNHSLRVGHVIQIIKECDTIEVVYEYDVESHWMEEMGYLPEFFSDIPKDVLQ